MPGLVFGVRPATSVNLSVGGGGENQLAVYQGEVSLQSETGTVSVKEGHGTKLSRRGVAVEIKQLLSAPNLVSPAGGGRLYNVDRVTLSWAGLQGAAEYVVEVARDPGFRELLSAQKVVSPTKTTVAVPGQGTFHWRVCAVDSDGLKGKSAVAAFTVKTDRSPPPIKLHDPVWK